MKWTHHPHFKNEETGQRLSNFLKTALLVSIRRSEQLSTLSLEIMFLAKYIK